MASKESPQCQMPADSSAHPNRASTEDAKLYCVQFGPSDDDGRYVCADCLAKYGRPIDESSALPPAPAPESVPREVANALRSPELAEIEAVRAEDISAERAALASFEQAAVTK